MNHTYSSELSFTEDLFDAPIPASRRESPYSSIKAEDELTTSGKLKSKRRAVYEALKRYSNVTARELSQMSGLDHPTVHKRLPELEKLGFVVRGEYRPCHITGKTCTTWYIKEK